VKGAYYNDIDPRGAASLRELIRERIIAPGDVDERSIEDVRPADLAGYVQCHFFAGTGVWSYALRCAGWPDDRPVWTGSCPCQPFSAAGKGSGLADERHLWPAFFHLVRVRRPVAVFGEQVSAKDGLAWFNHVRSDLEGEGYTVGVSDLCAAGFGAPHIRQRLYFVADADVSEDGRLHGGRENGSTTVVHAGAGLVADASDSNGRPRERGPEEGTRQDGERRRGSSGDGVAGIVDDPGGSRRSELWRGRYKSTGSPKTGVSGVMGNTEHPRREGSVEQDLPGARRGKEGGIVAATSGPCNGFWSDAAWVPCRDGKWRPIEPGTFPLAHGAAARVGRLHLYGNAIVAPVAEAFVRAYMEIRG
jgi:DNA (cytosine-5)-methyltransferase 1